MQTNIITPETHRSSPLHNDSTQRKDAGGNAPIITNHFLHELIHSVGHDLRSPMFVIRSYSQLLQRNQNKDRLDRGLNMISDATLSMQEILDGLVQLVDIYTLPIPSYEKLDFNTVLEAVQVQLYNEFKQFNPKIVADFSACTSVNFPLSYLKVIFSILLDNAMRHNADYKDLVISITSKQEGNRIILEVSDNGIHDINTIEISKLKDPFYSNSQDQSLAGIGLSKVEAIASKVNGLFKIDRSLDQKKVAFRFVFP